eukprot:2486521-Rhodomonas_salina.1
MRVMGHWPGAEREGVAGAEAPRCQLCRRQGCLRLWLCSLPFTVLLPFMAVVCFRLWRFPACFSGPAS